MIYLYTLSFLSRVVNKLKFPRFIKNILDDMSYNYTEKKILPFLKESELYIKSHGKTKGNNSGIIWIFWWQGVNDMPPIVRRCVKSIEYNSNNHNVIIISKKNIFKYTNISPIIFEKLSKGNMTITHFSDIVRFNLLSNHGGLWVDATVYCTSPITDDYFNDFYTSGGYDDIGPKFISGRWTGFLIGGNKNNDLFRFMNHFFEAYWDNNNRLIQYFLIDYGLEYAYRNNIGEMKNYVDNVACYNNPKLFEIGYYLNDNFDKKKYYDMISNTNMFKLTYKLSFKKDSNTFYKKIINDDDLFKNDSFEK